MQLDWSGLLEEVTHATRFTRSHQASVARLEYCLSADDDDDYPQHRGCHPADDRCASELDDRHVGAWFDKFIPDSTECCAGASSNNDSSARCPDASTATIPKLPSPQVKTRRRKLVVSAILSIAVRACAAFAFRPRFTENTDAAPEPWGPPPVPCPCGRAVVKRPTS
jgi:hypothetical protein